MGEPLTKSQQSLRGRNVKDMTVDQLHDWIAACDAMEHWVASPKARRSWTTSREQASAELQNRSASEIG